MKVQPTKEAAILKAHEPKDWQACLPFQASCPATKCSAREVWATLDAEGQCRVVIPGPALEPFAKTLSDLLPAQHLCNRRFHRVLFSGRTRGASSLPPGC